MEIKGVSTKKAPEALGPYSQGILMEGKMLFVSGQIPIDPATGAIVDGDIAAQTKQVMENLKAVVEEAGASLSQIVKTTIFIKDMENFAKINDVYGCYFQENPPARACVEVARLPKDVGIEIEAIACL